MSRNILLTLAFDGTAYHGWQLQQNADTVQARVNAALSSVLNEPVNVSGCSRTDTGVHAEMFCCNFHTEKAIPAEKLVPALNFYLPQDIAVYSAEEKEADFHARFSVHKKCYRYKIYNSPIKNAFLSKRCGIVKKPLDEKRMIEASKILIGEHDFKGFCSANTSVENFVRTIYDINIARNEDFIKIDVCGSGFLYNMVRIIVGTLVDYALGKLSLEDIILAL